ncbi:hypothetical protein PG984_013060 [Apiospora sp. TS-2023a]
MESVAAVGVAAAAVQFFGVVVKATALCREIRDNAESATDNNRGLEASPTPLVRRRVTEWANKCQRESDELLRLLEEVRGVGRTSSMARNLFRAIKNQRRIEKLERSLQTKKEALHDIIQHDTWRLAGDQKRELRTILEGLTRINLTTGDIIKESTTQITTRLDQTETSVNKHFIQAERSASRRHEEVTGHIQSYHEESKAAENSREFLRSLFFPEILERQSYIKGVALGTLEWIFDHTKAYPSTDNHYILDQEQSTLDQQGNPLKEKEYYRSASGRPWNDLPAWLRNGNGVYWINGKAGSGKSTLMAHIVEDPRTKAALDIWCGVEEKHILSYFFWRAGTMMQKSVVGLLRSLLYQICGKQTNHIEALMARLGIKPSMLHTWTEKSLKMAFHEVVNIATKSKFCIFVDGLDEFAGDYAELVELLFELQDHENVKFCISSRPEIQLSNRLSSCKTLRLQDLNLSDLRQYAWLKLSGTHFNPYVGEKQLHVRLAEMAEGVFLWVVLVVQSVMRGIEAGDDDDTLLERIKVLPQDLDDLFSSMLRRIDKYHRTSLAFYLQTLIIAEDYLPKDAFHEILAVATLTASRAPDSLQSMTLFEVACKQTESQVSAQSLGLLEIHELAGERDGPSGIRSDYGTKDRGDVLDEAKWSSEHVWLRVKNPTTFPRERQTCTVEYPKILKYEQRRIAWMHRCAYDFVHDPDNAKDLHLLQSSPAHVLAKLYGGFTALILSAPSSVAWDDCYKFYKSLTEHRLQWILQIMSKLWKPYTTVTREATDNLRLAITKLDPREMIKDACYWKDLESFLPGWTFWSQCMDACYWEYLLERPKNWNTAFYGLLLYRAVDTCDEGVYKMKRVMQCFGDAIPDPEKDPVCLSPEARLVWLISNYEDGFNSRDLPPNTRRGRRTISSHFLRDCTSMIPSRLGRQLSIDQETRSQWYDAIGKSEWFIEITSDNPVDSVLTA